jgi:hypothetical protein
VVVTIWQIGTLEAMFDKMVMIMMNQYSKHHKSFAQHSYPYSSCRRLVGTPMAVIKGSNKKEELADGNHEKTIIGLSQSSFPFFG